MAIGDGKAKIYISGVQLGEVNSFKYLVVSEDGCSTTDINIKTATAEMSRLYRVWHSYNHVYCKALYKFLVVPILLYGYKERTYLPTGKGHSRYSRTSW